MKVAVFNDTRHDNFHYGCYLVMDNLIHHLKINDIHPVFFWPVGRDWRRERHALPPRDSIEGIIVNGEGSIHHSRDRANYLSEIGKLAKEYYRVPCFLINATLYNNKRELYQKCKYFNNIYVRDGGSLDELHAFDLDGKVVPDLTLSVARPRPTILRQGIGATDSVVKDVDYYIKRFCGQRGYQYIPMVRTDLRPKDFLKLDRIIRRFQAYFQKHKMPQSERPKDVEGFLKWLEGKQLILTGRYHTVALCLLTRTPFLCFESNTPKISFLLEDVFGDTKRLMGGIEDIEKLNMGDYALFSECENAKINRFIDQSIASNQEMFSNIKTSIQSRS
jgi:hypothetical protein